jgi:sugar phosphate isomerase/epimerase
MNSRALISALCLAALVVASCRPGTPPPPLPELGLQAWTFRKLTLAEAITKTSQLGIRSIEVYPGQKLGGGIEGSLTPQLEPAKIEALKKILAENHVTIAGYGVVMQATDEEWKQIFAFAKSFGMRWISAEPPAEMLPTLFAMAKESGIKVAIHNHPAPSRYSDPDALMQTLAPYGPELGLCADTGHWARSGFNPLEKLRLCLPRVITLHFKDLNEWTKNAQDVPWGTGVSDAAGMLAALRQHGFGGVVLMEYENDSEHLADDLQRCADFFRSAMTAPLEKLIGGVVAPPGYSAEIAKVWTGERKGTTPSAPEYAPLFKPDLSNADFPAGSWTLTDGILRSAGAGAMLWTAKDYGDFVLDLEFRAGPKANSGIFLRATDLPHPAESAMEIEIVEGGPSTGTQASGAIYSVKAPELPAAPVPGRWHRCTIVAQSRNIIVFLDGQRLHEARLEQWKLPKRNPDGSPNNIRQPLGSLPLSGRLGFQGSGGQDSVEFRNIRIMEL